MMDTVKSFLRSVMDLAMVVIPLSVVLGVIFGPAVPFIGADVINNISAIIADLGSTGLVGIIVLGILWSLGRR
jgi:phosphotransferase system  glucose/maltose/N-acetylglucosamine-specific IIC component